jgi:Helix-turn-helix domain
MAKVNISQAARMAGVSRPTIHKKINEGALSAEKANGQTFIDVSELERVFGTLRLPGPPTPTRQDLHLETPQVISLLQSHIERLERELDTMREETERERRAREREEEAHRAERWRLYGIIEKQALQLPLPTETVGIEKKPWWRRWVHP